MKLTSDPFILDIVTAGLKLDLTEIPAQKAPQNHPLSKEETNIIIEEVTKLRTKKVVFLTCKEEEEFVSGVFTREKKDGTKRMILNLKKFNKHVQYRHFKMESIKNVLDVLRPNVYMASIDLKDAFYSVPIFEPHQKYLKFYVNNQLLKYACMPNGYSQAMRVFTKLTKVPFASLRGEGHISVVYVDDSYLQGDTMDSCFKNITDTIDLLQKLGFTIHPAKSVFKPSRQLEFLGFIINSEKMTISLTKEKKDKIYKMCQSLLQAKKPTIRTLARVIGNLVASFPGVKYGKLHYRNLENDKIASLLAANQNFNGPAYISEESCQELYWWLRSVQGSYNEVVTPDPDITIHTDASLKGWGITDGKNPSGGRWSPEEIVHINSLELRAVEFGIKTYCSGKNFQHVRVMCDNTTAINYINNMGGTKSKSCNTLAYRIWDWCSSEHLWLSAAHIPGVLNTEADEQSRKFSDASEWKLNPKLFDKIIKTMGMPDIDLFASRLNKQLDRYVSWHPEPDAIATNAFSLHWRDKYFYIFPPFSILGKTISKMERDGATAILIYPDWPTQHWYPMVQKLSQIRMMKFPPNKTNLMLAHNPEMVHPLATKMSIMAVQVQPSGY